MAIDIGGTKTLLAVFDDSGSIKESVRFPTSKDFEQFEADLAVNAAKLTTKEFKVGGIGIRGLSDTESGVMIKDSVLEWKNAHVSEACQKVFACSFLLENDSKLAGLSEATALPEFTKVLYLTISTGIGSAFIVDHQIDPNTESSEVGKSIYWHGGRYQKWEDFASGSAMVARYHKLAEEINDPTTWDEITDDWAIGIINICLAYTPEVVVIGGSVGEHFQKYQTFLDEAIEDLRPKEITMPPIKQAKHPDKAVVYGCYELIKNQAN